MYCQLWASPETQGALARTQSKLAGFVGTAYVTLALAVFCSQLPPTQCFLSSLFLVVGDSFQPRPGWAIASLVLTLSCLVFVWSLGVWLSLVFYFLEIICYFFERGKA